MVLLWLSLMSLLVMVAGSVVVTVVASGVVVKVVASVIVVVAIGWCW